MLAIVALLAALAAGAVAALGPLLERGDKREGTISDDGPDVTEHLDRLVDDALARTIAELQGEKNYRGHSAYATHPWLNVLTGTHPRELAHGRASIDDDRVGSWRLHQEAPTHRELYKTKVVECASQINLNGRQDTLTRMLDALEAAIARSPRLRRDSRGRIHNPFYTEPQQGGGRVTGADVIRFRRKLPGGKFHSKAELQQLIGPENFAVLRDFVTAHSWEDPHTFKATDGDDLVPRFPRPAAETHLGIGGRLGGGDALRHPPAARTPRIDAEPRHPINVNTAPVEVLIACIEGLAGRRILPYSTLSPGSSSTNCRARRTDTKKRDPARSRGGCWAPAARAISGVDLFAHPRLSTPLGKSRIRYRENPDMDEIGS